MAQASKRLRRERRLRREVSLYHRWTRDLSTLEQANKFIQSLQTQMYYLRATLLAILAQHGGSLEVTKGTIEQTIKDLDKLNFTQRAKEGDENTMVVSLVDLQEQAGAQAAPEDNLERNLTITRVQDEQPPDTVDAVPGEVGV